MGGGTEAFANLGQHCEKESCNLLDFLPFNCDGCKKVFCLEHRRYVDHNCPKAEHKDRVVVVCEKCSIALEKKEGEEDGKILEKHAESGNCDVTKKEMPKCPVKRCKQILTFSNTCTCKTCNQKVCLRHRFTTDHACSTASRREDSKFLLALASRTGDCRGRNIQGVSSPPSVKAC